MANPMEKPIVSVERTIHPGATAHRSKVHRNGKVNPGAAAPVEPQLVGALVPTRPLVPRVRSLAIAQPVVEAAQEPFVLLVGLAPLGERDVVDLAVPGPDLAVLVGAALVA